MPKRKLEVIEYRCTRCSYQWISRTVNEEYKKFTVGKHDSQEWNDDFYVEYTPKCCPRCKTYLWDKEHLGSEERSLRLKLIGTFHSNSNGIRERIGNSSVWELTYICQCFLYRMQPTKEELYNVLYPFGTDLYSEPYRDIDEAGRKRGKIMLEILKSHGINITEEEIAKYRQYREQEEKESDERWRKSVEYYNDMLRKGMNPTNKEDIQKYLEEVQV